MSISKLEDSSKISFIIFGAIHEFLHIFQHCSTNKPKETLTKIARSTRGQPHPPGQRPTGGPHGQAPHPGRVKAGRALTAAWARPRRAWRVTRAHTSHAATAAAAQRKAARRGEARRSPGERAQRGGDGGEPHRRQRGWGAAVRRWRHVDGRRRADRHDGGPTQRRGRSGEGQNRAREGRRCSPRKESARHSQRAANRRRPTELGGGGNGGGGRARVWGGKPVGHGS